MDFDISNMPISEFWVTIGDRLFPSQCHWARLFFSQNHSKEFFSKKKNPSPPPRISNGSCLTPCVPTVATDVFYLDFNACCKIAPQNMPLMCDNFSVDEYLSAHALLSLYLVCKFCMRLDHWHHGHVQQYAPIGIQIAAYINLIETKESVHTINTYNSLIKTGYRCKARLLSFVFAW